MKQAIDPLSTERYDLDASDIQYEDLQVMASYQNNPNMKFQPLNRIRVHWETQNFLYMAAMQVHDIKQEDIDAIFAIAGVEKVPPIDNVIFSPLTKYYLWNAGVCVSIHLDKASQSEA